MANNLVGKAIRTLFIEYFPNPEDSRKHKDKPNPYQKITDWFGEGNMVDVVNDSTLKDYLQALKEVPGLEALVAKYQKEVKGDERTFLMEFCLAWIGRV